MLEKSAGQIASVERDAVNVSDQRPELSLSWLIVQAKVTYQ